MNCWPFKAVAWPEILLGGAVGKMYTVGDILIENLVMNQYIC